MAEDLPGEGSSSRNAVSGESSDTNLELNVKTLDSRIFHFQVEKNMPISAFKEKIASDIGISAGQQRLIFRGKVLKDDHLLSQYHMENGDTLHLVERQPAQSQPSSGSGSGGTTSNAGSRGNDANAGAPRGRVGQISHSIVLGTFNVGDQGEGTVPPDITRVIGTVLNSIGLGNVAQVNVGGNGPSPVSVLNVPSQGRQGNGTDGSQSNAGAQGQAGNQPFGQGIPNASFQSLPQVVQIPVGAATIPLPSLYSPVQDSLSTLLEFMNRMEQALSQNVNQQNPSSTSSVELPRSARGLPTPEALRIVLHHAERLLSGQAVTALSHIAGRLEQDGSSSDPSVRGQIQAESSQTGIAMQHLGALFLELGRAMLTLRMGQSPGESFVNAGPAVYISSSGPNPIMVQPFPLQTNSLFGGLVPPVNPVDFGPVGVANPPRHINIHIHAGTSLAPVVSAAGVRLNTGDGSQGERGDSNESQDSGTVHPLSNVTSRPGSVPGSTTAQPIHISGTQSHTEIAAPLSSVIAEIDSQIRSLVDNLQEGNQAQTGGAATTAGNSSVGSASANEQANLVAADAGIGPTRSSTGSVLESADKSRAESSRSVNLQDSRDHVTSIDATVPGGDAMPSLNSKGASSSSGSHSAREGTNSIPLGLGLGGLERKKRAKQPKPQTGAGDGGPTSILPERTTVQASGQQLLQSLLSRGLTVERTNANTQISSSPSMGQATNSNTSSEGQVPDSQFNVAGMMSQVLQSPSLNGLLSGVAEQTGVGSPNVLRNMLQQLTQSPVMMNTMDRIAQQVETQDLGSMFSGMGGGQGSGGRIDLSHMVQQMMPIVSQALGGGPPGTEQQPGDSWHDVEDRGSDRIDQVELESIAREIGSLNPPELVFRAVAEGAIRSSVDGSGSQDLLDALCTDEELANEYAEMLGQDLGRRLQGDHRTTDR